MRIMHLRRLDTIVRTVICGMTMWMACGASAADAQTDPVRPALQIGPVEFRPRLLFSNIGVDNNVFNDATNPKRDFTLTASPDLEVSMHPGRLRAAYTTRTDFVYFRTYKDERSIGRSFGARVDLDLGLVKPFVALNSSQTSARPNTEIDARVPHHPRSYSAGSAVKIASRSSIGLSVRRSIETYAEGATFRRVDLATALDNTVNAYEGSFSVQLTPFTTVSLNAARERQLFHHTPLRNSESIRLAPSVVFSPLGLITGSASVGYRQFNGDDPSLPDYTGVVADGRIGVLILGRYNLTTTFTHDVRYSYEDTLPYYLVSGARATLAVQAVGALDLRILGGRESMNYRALDAAAAPGSDRLLTYGGGAGYRLGDRCLIVIEAEFSDRLSPRDPSREYRNHRVVASVDWGATNR